MPRPKRPAQSLQKDAPEPAAEPEVDQTAAFAEVLGVSFRDLDLLRLALTHRSVIHDWVAAAPGLELPAVNRRSNERLEFLGDSVLGYVVADLLYSRYPDATEGELTSRRVSLVRAERLVRWARAVNLGEYLYLGQGERVSDSARDRMLAGAFEAVIGAITIDRGMREARKFVRRFVEADLDAVMAELGEANPKGRLQEFVQEEYRISPEYRTLSAEGPAHDRTFTIEVSIDGRPLGVGTGSSKRQAEQAAASAALTAIAPAPSTPAATPPVQRRRKRPQE